MGGVGKNPRKKIRLKQATRARRTCEGKDLSEGEEEITVL